MKHIILFYFTVRHNMRLLKTAFFTGLVLVSAQTLRVPAAQGATSDALFNDCMQQLNDDHDVLKDQVWRTGPLNKTFYSVLKPSLTGDHVIRWLPHENDDGSLTVIVMTRDPDPTFEADDPDSFTIMDERNGHVSLNEIIAVHAMVFTKAEQHGVAGVLSCKDDLLASGSLSWDGNTWN